MSNNVHSKDQTDPTRCLFAGHTLECVLGKFWKVVNRAAIDFRTPDASARPRTEQHSMEYNRWNALLS